MSEKGMKWYVLRAVSGKEAKVKEYIEAAVKNNDMLKPNVGEILLPTEKYAMLLLGRSKNAIDISLLYRSRIVQTTQEA